MTAGQIEIIILLLFVLAVAWVFPAALPWLGWASLALIAYIALRIFWLWSWGDL